ncbi:MAG TPA: sialate O-acetylesterase, partial [Bryobacteraceae bacterium]|nr:sialate O-acetylesterase [Bryobacteraceae bacterium]
LLVLAGALPVLADVRLPYLFADGMVLQRDMPVQVWGSANGGERVEVSFRGASRTTKADQLGRWSVALPPGTAGGPFELNVNARVFRDVLVGDVWIAAGQSNMEWPVRWSANPDAERASARYPKIRLARTMHRVSGHPLSDWVGQQWQPCSPESVEHFSAVAYHFGRELHTRTGIPIGLIQSAWGGTPIEAWTSLRGISSDPGLMPVFREWARLTEQHEVELLQFPTRMAMWKAQAAKARAQGRAAPEPPEMRRRPGGQWTPGGLFNAMIAPLTRWGIRGVIWYQGEANTSPERAPLYERLLPILIQDWREQWGQGAFPFIIVQLANYKAAPDSMWPTVRDAQRRALSVASTALAVTVDIGDPEDIHPRNKREVGRRLALAVEGLTGPLLRQAIREGDGFRLWFDHVHGGLRARANLAGFEVASTDGIFRPATATIQGETVLVQGVPNPAWVRYAWSDNPQPSLFNARDLPASPFLWPKR